MCTSFTYQATDGSNALARTMDFTIPLNPKALMVPRNYSWVARPDQKARATRYAFTGLGRTDEGPLLADGVNERGLSCATLYFPGFASYRPDPEEGKTNLAPSEVVFWALAHFGSVQELRSELDDLVIVDIPDKFLGTTPPLHWIVTDKTGETIVIEPVDGKLAVYDNPLGVMSNSPDFPWHLTNIRNYLGVSPFQLEPITLSGMTFEPFGQGSGTIGLPGDYTPPSRFLRVLFGKEAIARAENEADTVTTTFHLLSSVDIPKGNVRGSAGTDYTQHASVMLCGSSTYYFKTYDNSQICRIDLLAEDLDVKDIKVWEIPQEQSIMALNGR